MAVNFKLKKNADSIESDIRTQKLFDLPVEWSDEVVYPVYDGLSIRNIPHTIGSLLGVPFTDDVTLDSRVWADGALDDVERVVMFLSDGLGYLYLRELMEEDPEIEDTILALTDGRGFVPITSVAPSTTAVALPSLWTGATPITHGMLGTTMFLREVSTSVNMLKNTPVGNLKGTVLSDTDLDKFIPVKRLAQHLADENIATHLLLLRSWLGKGLLSAVLHRGVTYGYAHGGLSDFWLRLAEVLHQTVGQRCYINVYYSPVDTLSHLYGAKNHYIHYEIKNQLKQLVEVLSSEALQDGQTLLILTADHGHADAPRKIDLQSTSAEPIRKHMRIGLTGDMRLGHLHLQNETSEEVINYIHTQYGQYLTAVETTQAISAGLFGHDTVYSESKHRLGDVILIPRLGTQIIDPSVGILDLESWHGGLSEDEMLVPFIYTRF